jgi:hypothetical protein
MAIISIAQQARPKVMGQIEFFRPQLRAKSRLVTMRPSSKRFSIQDIGVPGVREPKIIAAREGGAQQGMRSNVKNDEPP